MSDSIDGWPFHGLELVKTIASTNGRRRVHFGKRSDGSIQFFFEELLDDVDQGQTYSIWHRQSLSGIYLDLGAAEMEAFRLYPQLATTRC